ncbi:hypothetical protein [[Clostridium] polysaccharolyticum]|uniref:Uncharacterized protein n=1 Tax=[Clostridium] polysaccharolyticum TaxID=29364 RepID=A0A1I0FPX2_9FIRM|nr:hypothetical protein [[Clostridium] polysaccharolyticum]SET59637.1 hypothetical protein SAMN04487772_13410 [[Clostridium] polysaccharolyticum]
MQMILNELSANFPVCGREEGKKIMSHFLEVYQEIRKVVMNDSLVMDKHYNSFFLAKDYHISEWRNDPTVDREKQRLFRSIINKAIVYDGREIDDVKIDILSSEFKYKMLNAIGCLIAYETGNFVLSFATHECWKEKFIKGLYSNLYELETVENPRKVAVLNVSKVEDKYHIKTDYLEQINSRYRSVKCGKEILYHSKEWLPSIQFCDNAVRQLQAESNYMNVQQILKKLLELNDYFAELKGNFDVNALKNCTPESEITLKHYKKEHTFRTPSGKEEIFSFHLRFTGTYAGRIFFKPDIENNTCIVAHIGKKLKNQTFH